MSVRVWILDSSPDVQFFKINMNGHHLLILFLLITFTFFSIFMYTFSRNYINTAVNGQVQFIKSAHLPTLYEHRQPDKRIHEIKVSEHPCWKQHTWSSKGVVVGAQVLTWKWFSPWRLKCFWWNNYWVTWPGLLIMLYGRCINIFLMK